jgi:hypothetical protein
MAAPHRLNFAAASYYKQGVLLIDAHTAALVDRHIQTAGAAAIVTSGSADGNQQQLNVFTSAAAALSNTSGKTASSSSSSGGSSSQSEACSAAGGTAEAAAQPPAAAAADRGSFVRQQLPQARVTTQSIFAAQPTVSVHAQHSAGPTLFSSGYEAAVLTAYGVTVEGAGASASALTPGPCVTPTQQPYSSYELEGAVG